MKSVNFFYIFITHIFYEINLFNIIHSLFYTFLFFPKKIFKQSILNSPKRELTQNGPVRKNTTLQCPHDEKHFT